MKIVEYKKGGPIQINIVGYHCRRVVKMYTIFLQKIPGRSTSSSWTGMSPSCRSPRQISCKCPGEKIALINLKLLVGFFSSARASSWRGSSPSCPPSSPGPPCGCGRGSRACWSPRRRRKNRISESCTKNKKPFPHFRFPFSFCELRSPRKCYIAKPLGITENCIFCHLKNPAKFYIFYFFIGIR